jgi:hypothetical protein
VTDIFKDKIVADIGRGAFLERDGIFTIIDGDI